MNRLSKNRALSLFLALMMIFMSFPISSIGATGEYNIDDYMANVGAIAMFNTSSPYDVLLCDHPDNFAWDKKIPNADISGDLRLVITDCYINDKDQLFYKVEAAAGHTLPAILEQYPWIYQNDLGMDEESDALIIVEPADKEVVLEDLENGVTVTGYIPNSVELQVSGVSDAKMNAVSNGLIDKSAFGEIVSISGKDITLLDRNSGKTWQPGATRPVTVTISNMWSPRGKEMPSAEIYHILSDADAISNAIAGGYLLTSSYSELVALYPDAAALMGGNSVPYVRMSSRDGAVQMLTDGSISFLTDSFSDYFIVLGFTEGLTLSEGTHTYYVEPGTTLKFNRNVTQTGTPVPGISVSGSTVTVDATTVIPSEAKFTSTWSGILGFGGGTADITIKVVSRRELISNAFNDTDFPVILSVVQNITSIPSEPGLSSGSFYQIGSDYTSNQRYPPNKFISLTAHGVINPDISDLLTKSIDNSNTIGYADATGVTILRNLNGIDWNRILEQAVDQKWKAIDGTTITDANKNRYKILPYVIKLMDGANSSGKGWHIDCAIVLKDNVTLSYDMNLDNYQVSGKIKLPITASGIPTFSTKVNYLTHGSSDYNQSNLNVGSKINATYNGEQMTLTFRGWNTSPDGKGTTYESGAEISIAEDTVLYAIWEGSLVPGELYIYKSVTVEDGADEPNGAIYQFGVQFSTVATYNYTVYNADGSIFFHGSFNTQGNINLTNGQYAVFAGIPANTTYTVIENEGAYTTTIEGGSGVIRSGGRAIARFVNHYAYVEPEVTINYTANNGGNVTISSETVKVNTGDAQGSTAIADKGYHFVGWYSDSDCTNLLSREPQYVPKKENGTGWIDGTTFYAKFEPDNTSLTIEKQVYDYIDEYQTFVFDVVEVDVNGNIINNGPALTVTVHGDGSIIIDGLVVGHYYRITEKTEWSWRYDKCTPFSDLSGAKVEGNSITVQLSTDAQTNKVTFVNERTIQYWLDGDSWCNNIFK